MTRDNGEFHLHGRLNGQFFMSFFIKFILIIPTLCGNLHVPYLYMPHRHILTKIHNDHSSQPHLIYVGLLIQNVDITHTFFKITNDPDRHLTGE